MRDIPAAPINFEALDANTRAQAIANVFGVRVAIVHNGNDGPGRVWDCISERPDGTFHANGCHIVDIVKPQRVPMPDGES
jgi:hypothetical protein